MAWTAPMTAVTNSVLTAAQWNANVRDNFSETAVAKASAAGTYFVGNGTNAIAERTGTTVAVTTTETTASTSYTDLATAGPSATVTVAGAAMAVISASFSNNTVNATSYMGLDLSGSTTLAAGDSRAVASTSATANAGLAASYVAWYTLTAGSNTFTAKHRVSAGTGTFSNRRLIVMAY